MCVCVFMCVFCCLCVSPWSCTGDPDRRKQHPPHCAALWKRSRWCRLSVCHCLHLCGGNDGLRGREITLSPRLWLSITNIQTQRWMMTFLMVRQWQHTLVRKEKNFWFHVLLGEQCEDTATPQLQSSAGEHVWSSYSTEEFGVDEINMGTISERAVLPKSHLWRRTCSQRCQRWWHPGERGCSALSPHGRSLHLNHKHAEGWS